MSDEESRVMDGFDGFFLNGSKGKVSFSSQESPKNSKKKEADEGLCTLASFS